MDSCGIKKYFKMRSIMTQHGTCAWRTVTSSSTSFKFRRILENPSSRPGIFEGKSCRLWKLFSFINYFTLNTTNSKWTDAQVTAVKRMRRLYMYISFLQPELNLRIFDHLWGRISCTIFWGTDVNELLERERGLDSSLERVWTLGGAEEVLLEH